MRSFINKLLARHNLPRKLILIADLAIMSLGFLFATVLRFNWNIDDISLSRVIVQLTCVVSPLYLISFLITGSYRGIIRHSSLVDINRLLIAVTAATVAGLSVSYVMRGLDVPAYWVVPYSVTMIHAVITFSLLLIFRLLLRTVHKTYASPRKGLRQALIFGAGELGYITAGIINNDNRSNLNVVGFIDDNRQLRGKRLSGKRIYTESEAFDKIIHTCNISDVILAVSKDRITMSRKKVIFERCLEHGLRISELAPVNDWINGVMSQSQIREVKIEDLLGREPIWLDQEKVTAELKGSVVLVAGAAGSIGSEITRKIMGLSCSHVVLIDQAESSLYDLQNELMSLFPRSEFTCIVASVTDHARMYPIFAKYRPQYVFNAAAYKHVPLMEESPYEAIRVNVGGTRLLADLSVQFGAAKFIMISTDKAVNPTNVMGASKRICELYVQSLARSGCTPTQFITTRFGNVLGSNGSVIPLFHKQIAAGGPVTITHPDIIRYFMTIPEACQLVLEACFMGKGGEIYVFDMGEPVRIYDLAVKMISLAGFRPDIDIPIKITGLRPGEKLYEELLADKEKTIPTHHPKIMVANGRKHDFNKVKQSVHELIEAIAEEPKEELVIRMKDLIPEFISQNSEFCKYDELTIMDDHS